MYNNIGGKIKGLATTVFIFSAIASIITGIVFMSFGDEMVLYGLLAMVGGTLLAWISSWCLYGFGELIDKTCDIARSICPDEIKTQNDIPYQVLNETPFRAPAPVQANSSSDVNKFSAPVRAEMSNGEKVCPKCGTSQRADRKVCWSCGQHFDN